MKNIMWIPALIWSYVVPKLNDHVNIANSCREVLDRLHTEAASLATVNLDTLQLR